MRGVIDERYAEALANVAFRIGAVQGFADDLETVGSAVAADPGIGRIFGNPRISTDIKIRIIDEVFSGNTTDTLFVNFLKVLAKAGRIGHLSDIYKEYIKVAMERYKVLTITIETPVELAKEQIDEVKKKCLKQFGADAVREKVILNRSLIGGMKVTANGIVIDGSLKKQLEDMEILLNK
jgi:F-type H+-transporting ATPase subunit delta